MENIGKKFFTPDNDYKAPTHPMSRAERERERCMRYMVEHESLEDIHANESYYYDWKMVYNMAINFKKLKSQIKPLKPEARKEGYICLATREQEMNFIKCYEDF